MNKAQLPIARRGCGRMHSPWLYAVILALAAAIALPARSADERAIRSRIAPVYPELAKRMKISGVVRVEATIDAEGKVIAVKTISGSHVLSQAAEEAVSKWKYAPAAESTTVEVDVNFALAQ